MRAGNPAANHHQPVEQRGSFGNGVTGHFAQQPERFASGLAIALGSSFGDGEDVFGLRRLLEGNAGGRGVGATYGAYGSALLGVAVAVEFVAE